MTDFNPYSIKPDPSSIAPLDPLPDFVPGGSYLIHLPGDKLIHVTLSLGQPDDAGLVEVVKGEEVRVVMMDTIAALLQLAAKGQDLPDKAQYVGLPRGLVLHCYKKAWSLADQWDWRLHGRELKAVGWKLKLSIARG